MGIVSGDFRAFTSRVTIPATYVNKQKKDQYRYVRTDYKCWKCRVSLTLNMYFASLKFTSPSFVSSMVNTIASLTFVIAVILRYSIFEVLKSLLFICSETYLVAVLSFFYW